ncbi:ABC transporter permease [Inquilinus sp. YAF38]|uniref:ABC transporter permease n=1 Tax=Inquilinus sp. YAF38 TaxID=3233084 RepID=UPI003F8E7E35
MSATQVSTPQIEPSRRRFRMPVEASIFLVLVGICVLFEALGWYVRGQSFLVNPQRLLIIVLQVSIVGLLAVGATQVIITSGVDLSPGSVLALAAMVSATFAQGSSFSRVIFPALTDMPVVVPLAVGLLVGGAAGLVNGALIAKTGIPPFIATLGMMVAARGAARAYTDGAPVSGLLPAFTWIGQGSRPVILFLVVALIFHVALRYTRYGKFTYAIGANPQAARVSGIDVGRHLMLVYTIAGLLAGLGGIVMAARNGSGQANMGTGYELDAIAAAVIGGTSLAGGVGRITGTVIGTVILGVMTSGFTFLGIDAYYQDIVKGGIIIAAVAADQYRQRRRRRA